MGVLLNPGCKLKQTWVLWAYGSHWLQSYILDLYPTTSVYREMDAEVERTYWQIVRYDYCSGVPEMGRKQQLNMNILSTFHSYDTNGNGQLNMDQ